MTYAEISRRLRSLGIFHDESWGYDFQTKKEYLSVFVRFGDDPKKRAPAYKEFGALLKAAGFDVADKGLLIKTSEVRDVPRY